MLGMIAHGFIYLLERETDAEREGEGTSSVHK